MPLRGLRRFINFVFKFFQLLLSCSHYSSINKPAKTVNIIFKMKTKGTVQHLDVDAAEFCCLIQVKIKKFQYD
ncbi:Mobile element protein (plasmid) [Candidatus Enterovibrio altilux]|uniref:Mobile element protein n=1 Tax=Candidatus Enterovibrio altilux TaxID=1927128 RepID=A0A291BAQ8_9GAMM|nr:Mobile element protein [Candidatus Enterovibrio luxaltus]